MESNWSRSWKSSVQPRKQRAFVRNAPLHVKQKLLAAHLTKELMKKYKMRSITVRAGDKVKVVRGQFKSKTGKITKVSLQKSRVYVEGAEQIKKDGTKALYPIHPSNLIVMDLLLDDKKRKKTLERKK
ncbi:50S ribosomal protein L24 [Candidatus Woesearchaeota archaeon]|nr:50S ribosomal protein L24 [Candidatus Woesearchaeota archaeon]